MIESLTASQLETLRMTIEYLWGRSYTKDVFNKSTLVMLMREQLDLRQNDIQWGKTEGRTEERTLMRASMKTAAEQMVQEGIMTKEQVEEFFTRTEALRQSQEKQ